MKMIDAMQVLTMDDDPSPEDSTAAMQSLIDSGQAWLLEGHMGREAMRMIKSGMCALGPVFRRDAYRKDMPSRMVIKDGEKGSLSYANDLREVQGLPRVAIDPEAEAKGLWDASQRMHWWGELSEIRSDAAINGDEASAYAFAQCIKTKLGTPYTDEEWDGIEKELSKIAMGGVMKSIQAVLAFEKGRNDRQNGVKVGDNPYLEDDPRHF